MRLGRGAVVLVSLDPTIGREQRGTRPCVVVSDPTVTDDQRFPVLCVVPITGTRGEGGLYPALEPGAGGLRKRSFALIDQVRTIGKRRVRKVFGRIEDKSLDAIDDGLRLFLGL